MLEKTTDIDVKKKFANLALKWCKHNLGVNKKKKKSIKLFVRIKPQKEGKYIVFGRYYIDTNSIYVYGLKLLTIHDVVATVIHEYTHYLQSNKKYWEYAKTHHYSTHPYERQARRNEKKYTSNCLNEISKLII
jgi:hypothetical protein